MTQSGKERITNPFAIVTGASGGIGLDIAKNLAKQGYNLVLVARNSKLLSAISEEISSQTQAKVTFVSADLSTDDGTASVISYVKENNIDVEVLVNNAGYGVYGNLIETDATEEHRMLQLNMVALTALTKAFLPQLIARKKGFVLNVASTAAFQPGPGMAAYYASKAYVLSFSEAVDFELRGTRVSVTTLCPGPTPTGFQDRAQMHGSRLLNSALLTTSRDVARAGLNGLFKRKRIVIPGLLNKIMAQSVRFTPRWLVLVISNFAAAR